MFVIRLLLFLPILTVAARRKYHPTRTQPTFHGIKWLEEGRSLLVRLETPDLLLWNATEKLGYAVPNALILNFTISTDRRHLLLQDEPFLPLPHVHRPPRIFAPQTSQTLREFEDQKDVPKIEYNTSPWFALDYDRLVHPRDDPSIRYYNHHPQLTLNLLGAGIEGFNTLLTSSSQRLIKITLKDYHSPTSNPPNHKFMIESISLWDRDHNTEHTPPSAVRGCTRWSWRCEDFGDEPWYRYIYRHNFDQYGRVGSMRHEILQRCDNTYNRLGWWRLVLLCVFISIMALSPFLYALYKKAIAIRARRLALKEEEASWLGCGTETAGLLNDDGDNARDEFYENDEREENNGKAMREGEASREKPLPPVPSAGEDLSERS
ncbi:hypothetical protein BJ875DRAFT_236178 [Amylocarpus encephaloides]|uniref:Uncharacterized protein n=1 Tax=Amylocarpus encephaloides TaxID=45428 RepID=A0A9P8BZP7_9HELO|nr:hypothetical protein BJ875DRAFT_236178 [Amylocarpus encephaloides]